MFFGKATMNAQVSVQIDVAPPPLPEYDQPLCPADGYLWTPGYWAYGPEGYYWVPGVWIQPAQVGFLWTPGYWGFTGGYYRWNTGYWGPHIGFYGGVCYGHGYLGEGYYGGRWEGGRFRYNTAVTNINTTIVHNTYIDRTVVQNTTINRSSFNGEGGVRKEPNSNEQMAMKENHIRATSEQETHERGASQDRKQLASENKGRPERVAIGSVKEEAKPNQNSSNSAEKQEGNNEKPTRTVNNADRQNQSAAKSPDNTEKPMRATNNDAAPQHMKQNQAVSQQHPATSTAAAKPQTRPLQNEGPKQVTHSAPVAKPQAVHPSAKQEGRPVERANNAASAEKPHHVSGAPHGGGGKRR